MDETAQQQLKRIKQQHTRANEAYRSKQHTQVAEKIIIGLFGAADTDWLIEQAELGQKYLAALKGIDLNIHDTKQVSEILDIALEEQKHGNH
ncbi:hypothetical protein DHX103_14335 [Planococcus sp. X10-3]|uniref:hypothetical protein n=1 Tax=Planococcus sp. X10-3 TaxID=3061240 RepID=UPI003BB0EEFA